MSWHYQHPLSVAGHRLAGLADPQARRLQLPGAERPARRSSGRSPSTGPTSRTTSSRGPSASTPLLTGDAALLRLAFRWPAGGGHPAGVAGPRPPEPRRVHLSARRARLPRRRDGRGQRPGGAGPLAPRADAPRDAGAGRRRGGAVQPAVPAAAGRHRHHDGRVHRRRRSGSATRTAPRPRRSSGSAGPTCCSRTPTRCSRASSASRAGTSSAPCPCRAHRSPSGCSTAITAGSTAAAST